MSQRNHFFSTDTSLKDRKPKYKNILIQTSNLHLANQSLTIIDELQEEYKYIESEEFIKTSIEKKIDGYCKIKEAFEKANITIKTVDEEISSLDYRIREINRYQQDLSFIDNDIEYLKSKKPLHINNPNKLFNLINLLENKKININEINKNYANQLNSFDRIMNRYLQQRNYLYQKQSILAFKLTIYEKELKKDFEKIVDIIINHIAQIIDENNKNTKAPNDLLNIFSSFADYIIGTIDSYVSFIASSRKKTKEKMMNIVDNHKTFLFENIYHLFISMIIYLFRYFDAKPSGESSWDKDFLNWDNLPNLLKISFALSVKMIDDKTLKDKTIATYLGFSIKEFCSLERKFMQRINHNLHISREDFMVFNKLFEECLEEKPTEHANSSPTRMF